MPHPSPSPSRFLAAPTGMSARLPAIVVAGVVAGVLGLFSATAMAQDSPPVPPIAPENISPIMETDARRLVAEAVLRDLFHEHRERPDGIDSRIDAGHWLALLHRELSGASAREGAEFEFLAFVTPGAELDGKPRAAPFDVMETLRRAYVNAGFLCLGAVTHTRLVFEVSRQETGNPERWQICVEMRRTRNGDWRVAGISDPEHLRFCLLERRHTRGPTPAFPTLFLVAAETARAACTQNVAPSPLTLLDREAIAAMGLDDPATHPLTLIDSIDAESRTVRFAGNEALRGPWRVGQKIRDVAGREFRIVALGEFRVTLANWANRKFVLDSRAPHLAFSESGFRPLTATENGNETGFGSGTANAPDNGDENGPGVAAIPADAPAAPVGVAFTQIFAGDARVDVTATSGEVEQIWVRVGGTFRDRYGREFRVTAIGGESLTVENGKGTAFVVPFGPPQ